MVLKGEKVFGQMGVETVERNARDKLVLTILSLDAQIELCHARMRRFSNATTDQMNTCSHKHAERTLAYGAPPLPTLLF